MAADTPAAPVGDEAVRRGGSQFGLAAGMGVARLLVDENLARESGFLRCKHH